MAGITDALDPNCGRSLHGADFVEITDNPDPIASRSAHKADLPWLAQRWRRLGDKGEAMFVVVGEVVGGGVVC